MNQIVGKKDDGSEFMALVLEPGNMHRLMNGEPITLRIEDMYPDGMPKKLELAILFSETPVADARQLSKMADVVLDERSVVQKSKKPHCIACKSTIEQIGVQRNDSPIALVFCPSCGGVLGTMPSAALAGVVPKEIV